MLCLNVQMMKFNLKRNKVIYFCLHTCILFHFTKESKKEVDTLQKEEHFWEFKIVFID